MTLGQRIRQLRLEHGFSQEELGAKIGVQKAAINKYETGTVVNLKPAIIEGLAKALYTTPAYLMGWEDPFAALPGSEIEMLREPPRITAMRPIVATAKAGWNGAVEAEYEGTRPVTDLANPEEYVWIRVDGDSMEPVLQDGDYILVHLQNTAENGNIVVAIVDGDEATIKRFERQNGIVLLKPENRQYPTRLLTGEALETLYIYGIVRKVERDFF